MEIRSLCENWCYLRRHHQASEKNSQRFLGLNLITSHAITRACGSEGETDRAEGETKGERIQEDDACSGGWSCGSALFSDRTDQLSTAISSRTLSKCGDDQVLLGWLCRGFQPGDAISRKTAPSRAYFNYPLPIVVAPKSKALGKTLYKTKEDLLSDYLRTELEAPRIYAFLPV